MKAIIKNCIFSNILLAVVVFGMCNLYYSNPDTVHMNRIEQSDSDPDSSFITSQDVYLPVVTASNQTDVKAGVLIAKASSKTQSKQDKTVYITKTGEKYHKSSCSSLKKSKIEIKLSEAKSQGYEPCKRCKP